MEVMRALKDVGDDYFVILLKLVHLEQNLTNKNYNFNQILVGYTTVIGLDLALASTFYTSKDYKDLVYKFKSVESGGTSHPEEIKEKRKALIEEIKTRTKEIIATDDTKPYHEIADVLVKEISERTEQEIEAKLKNEYPKWETNDNHERKLNDEKDKLVAALKISTRKARIAARDAADELKTETGPKVGG
jgi:chaperonin cofactor prefoldin